MKQKSTALVSRVGSLFGRVFSKSKDVLFKSEKPDVNQEVLRKLNKRRIPSLSQVKQLPKVLSKQEKIRLSIILAIFVLSSFGFGWRIYARNSVVVPAHGGEYTEGLVGAPRLVNPILASSDVDRDLVNLIFAGLLKIDENGEVVPDMAKAYTIDAAQEVYTFELRDNLRWHDGNPVTADDVIFTINSIQNPDLKSPLKNSFNGVVVKKINDKTVQFILEEPFAPFLSILTVGIIPEHLWYSIPAFGAALADLNTKPVGSGPYQFNSLTRDTGGIIRNYSLESYKDYHEGEAYISKLMFKFYADFDTAVVALQNDNIDGLVLLPNQYKPSFENQSKIELHNIKFPRYTAVYFNPENNAELSNNNFRQALARAIDKERILREVVNNDGQIIHSPILPGMLGYDPEIRSVEYSPDEARGLLEELGWTVAEGDAFRSKTSGEGEDATKTELTIKLTTIDQNENVRAISIIQENWEAIGVKTELEIIAKDRIKQDIIEPRNYEALVFGQVININSGPYPFWHSSQNRNPGLNLSVLANKDVDAALTNANSANSDEAKLEPLKNFQEKLLELNFAVFLYNPTYTYPVDDKVKGLDQLNFINLTADRLNNINTWYIKTKRELSN